MKLGLFLSAQHPPETDLRRALAEHLEQVRFVRDHGFSSVFAGQHFLSQPFAMFQLVPLLARVAAESGELRVGAGILLTALLNPVEVAENAATLDVVTGGRFVLGVGLGYRTEEDDAFGLLDRRVRAFTDKLDAIRRLLEGETVTAEGHGFRLREQRLALLPVQRPRPPIWIAANSDAAVLRAARLADTWFANPHVTTGELARQLELFRAERGAPPAELPGMREICIAATDEEALATAAPHLDRKYKAYVQWGQSEVLPETDTLRKEWDELREGRFLIGSPDTVLAGLRRQKELGFSELIVRAQWPGMPHRETMRTLRHLAELLPEL